MNDLPEKPSDKALRSLLGRVKTIALVGVSTNPVRPSFYVGRYLKLKGWRVLPVNPAYPGETVFGEPIAPSLAALAEAGERVDMVDIFRRSSEAGGVVDEALEHFGDRGLKAIWMQIGVVDEAAAARARARGVEVVMNLCPKMEWQRLVGELSKGGFNSGHLSSNLS